MRYLILLFLALGYIVAAGQDIMMPGEQDMDGIVVKNSTTYSGQSLYGYIDGGADLYLEYGFVKLFVTEYQWNKEQVKAEVWVMQDAPSAYGIYALSHSNCQAWNTLSSFSCISRYQSAAASGPLFISVTNSTGSTDAVGVCNAMVQKIVAMNPEDQWYMPPLFQSDKLGDFVNTIRYFVGPLGIQNGVPVMADLLEDLHFQMYTIVLTNPVNPGMIARLVFPDEGTVRTFLSRAQLDYIDRSSTPVQAGNGMYRSWYKVNDTKIIYLECANSNINLKDFIPPSPPPYWLDN